MPPATPPCSPANAMNANAEAPAMRASKRNANNAATANGPRPRLSLEQAFQVAINTPAGNLLDEDMPQVNVDSAATATANDAAAAEAAASARPTANSEEPPPRLVEPTVPAATGPTAPSTTTSAAPVYPAAPVPVTATTAAAAPAAPPATQNPLDPIPAENYGLYASAFNFRNASRPRAQQQQHSKVQI